MSRVFATVAAAILWVPFRGRVNAGNEQVFGLSVYLLAYVLKWAAIWAALWQTAPNVLLSTTNGLESMLQVVAACIVALFVLVLGSVYVLAEQAITAYGTRAALILTRDRTVHGVILRPLLITIATVLLAGQVPQADAPSDGVSAAAAVLAISSASALLSTAAFLPGLLGQYTAPVNFARKVLDEVEDHLALGWTDLVYYKVPLFGEMLRTSTQRGDSPAIRASLEGLRRMTSYYVASAQATPKVRTHTFEDGTSTTGWMSDLVQDSVVSGGETALLSSISETDINEYPETLLNCLTVMYDGHQQEEARVLLDGLIGLGTTSHMVGTGGFTFLARPAENLITVEAHVEVQGDVSMAAQALAGWALVSAYPTYHFSTPMPEHPSYRSSIQRLGPAPPWRESSELVQSTSWTRKWANKQYMGTGPVLKVLRQSQRDHAKR